MEAEGATAGSPETEAAATAAAPAVAEAAAEKSPSETDAEFAERTAAKAATEKAPINLSPRAEFQSWINRNYRSIPFPVLAEIESLVEKHLGKLSAEDAKALGN